MKRILGVVLVLAILPFGLAASASMCEGKGEAAGCKMAEKLGLSAEQKQQVEKLHQGMQQKMVPLEAQLGVKKAELKVLWAAAAPEKKAILAKMAEMDTIELAMREAKVDSHLAVGKLLNAEQKTKFSAMGCGLGDCGDGPKCEGHGKKECSHGEASHAKMGHGAKSPADCPMHKEAAPKS